MRIAISLLGIFISVGLNAQTWSTMFGGAWGTVVTLFPKGDTVFSHGSFCDSSGSQIESSVFIFWDGNQWINPGYYDYFISDLTFVSPPVMALRNDTLYVGDHFGQLDTIENTSRIAGWYKDHFFSLSGQAFQNPYMVYGILSLHNFQNRIYLDGHHYCYPLDLITGLVYHDGIQWHNTDTNPMLGSGFTSHFFNFNDSLFIIGRLSLKRDGVWDQYYGLIVSDGYSFWVPPGTESFYQANAACVDTARNYLY
ncbi:MAG: hypothetical protein KKA07_07345, partial [Bacteroidetes bacterium]|nr:hypothetical protein [Bacteroidota bacterium]